ncbi:MAG: efflux RND transporter periplasmic adaptor subunit [Acidobacteriia bacterium]|nr:efflux RND transporter periplasmic adaptor subunit [Terriglobia bacterium]
MIGVFLRVLPGLLQKPPQNVVAASGRIEGREVTLAPKEIQGRIKTLLADEGQSVKKGQQLAELESKQLDARFASVAASVANLDQQIKQASIDVTYTTKHTAAAVAAAEAAVSSAKAHLARGKAVLENASVERDRALGLYREQVIPKSVLDQATMIYETSVADVNAAEKDLSQAEANLAVAQASQDTVALKRQQLRALQESRRAAEAQLEEARANLAERNIYAPADGTILSRPVEVGDVVSPGSPIFVMVDMNRLYLKVYIPEPEIPKIKLGDEAEITVDAFPGRTFAARVTKIYQQAEFTPKNVETKEERVKLVFGVELTFVKPEGLLKPGMPADAAIHWKAAQAQPGSP